ncbi:MAG TPA: hypothetical protein VGG03_01405 [Thermoanaerobaculia bacterium]|jgi:hypothetical protein
MSINRRLLAIIGRRLPAIYDVIPRGPLARFSRFSEVALNPQPLPPHELGAAIAAEFVHTAWLADRFGLDLGRAFEDLDDWCPTPTEEAEAAAVVATGSRARTTPGMAHRLPSRVRRSTRCDLG